MPIDPSIASGGTPVQIQNPLEGAAKVISIKHMMGDIQTQDVQRRTLMQAEQDREATKQALMSSGGDLSKAETLLLQNGLQGPALAIRKSRLEEEAKQAQISQHTSEARLHTSQFFRDQLGGVNDPQTYGAWRQSAVKAVPEWDKSLPPPEQFNPEVKQHLMMTADKAMEQQKAQQNQAAQAANNAATNKAADIRNIRTTDTALKIAGMRAKAAEMSATDRPAYVAGLRDLQKEDQNMAALAPLETGLKRFKELNADVPTGRIVGYVPAVGQPKRQEMEQIQNSLSMNNFRPGQGQMSNFERKLITGAGPNVHNDKEANDRIVDIAMGALQTMKEKSEFKQWYLDTNKKLLGADREWNAYVEKNPRFISGKDRGSIAPNPERQVWGDYFKAGTTSTKAAPASSGEDLFDVADRILQGAQ